MFVACIDFWITEKNVPRAVGRPLDKNRNVIYNTNTTCTASRKEGTKTTSSDVVSPSLYLSLSRTLKQKV
jgi:hypothetical protein